MRLPDFVDTPRTGEWPAALSRNVADDQMQPPDLGVEAAGFTQDAACPVAFCAEISVKAGEAEKHAPPAYFDRQRAPSRRRFTRRHLRVIGRDQHRLEFRVHITAHFRNHLYVII